MWPISPTACRKSWIVSFLVSATPCYSQISVYIWTLSEWKRRCKKNENITANHMLWIETDLWLVLLSDGMKINIDFCLSMFYALEHSTAQWPALYQIVWASHTCCKYSGHHNKKANKYYGSKLMFGSFHRYLGPTVCIDVDHSWQKDYIGHWYPTNWAISNCFPVQPAAVSETFSNIQNVYCVFEEEESAFISCCNESLIVYW